MPQVFDSQNAFNAGELSPRVLGRSLVPAYKAGLRLCENMVVLTPGGMERRPGTIYVAAACDETKKSRLISFRFSQQEAFILELAEGRLRVFKGDAPVYFQGFSERSPSNVDFASNQLIVDRNGWPNSFRVLVTDGTGTLPSGLVTGAVYTTAKAPSFALDQAADVAPATDILTSVAHGLTTEMGPFRFTSTILMPTGLSVDTDYWVRDITADTFKVALTKGGAAHNITAANTGTLTMAPTAAYLRSSFRLVDGAGVVVALADAGTAGWTIHPVNLTEPFYATHPYIESQLFDIQYAQDKDIVYLAHEGHEFARFVRYADHAWEWESFPLLDGPYLDLQEVAPGDARTSVQVQISAVAVGADRTATASSAIFQGSDKGRAIRLGDDGDAAEWGWGLITGVNPYTVQPGAAGVPIFSNLFCSAWSGTTTFNQQITWTTGIPLTVNRIAVGYVWSSSVAGISIGDTIYATSDAGAFFGKVYPTHADAVADTNAIFFASGSIGCWTSMVHDPGGHGFTDLPGPVTLSAAGTLPAGWSAGTEYALRVVDSDTDFFSIADLTTNIEIPPQADPNLVAPVTIDGGLPSTTCKVHVKEPMPAAATGLQDAWKLGAFGSSTLLGFPVAVGLHEQRLVLAGAIGTPQTVYGSFSGQQQNFAPDEIEIGGTTTSSRVLTESSGYSFRLVSEDLNSIGWLRPARALFAAGLGGVFHLTGATVTDTLTPASVNARRGTTKGAANVSPMMLGSAVIFVDEAQRRLQHGEFRPDIEAIQVDDLMQLADHLSYGFTINQIARTETPLPLLWAARSDGTLLACTLEQRQNVLAWARHLIGGTDAVVESVATLPDAQGGILWMVVRRTINGVTRRYIEHFADRIDEIADHELFQNGDSGLPPYDGATIPAGTPITGLSHLVGETVEIIADGGAHPNEVVSAAGTVTLDRDAAKVVVGLPFQARARLLPPEIEQPGQHLAMRTIRSITAAIRLNRSLGLKMGPALERLTELEFRTQLGPMNAPPPLFTGITEIAVPGGYERDGGLWLVSEQGFPLQILSVLQRIEVVQR